MISKKLRLSDKKLYAKYKKYIENYAPVMDYIKEKRLAKETEYKHINGFTLYCCSQDKKLEVLLKEAKNEEKNNVPINKRKTTERLDNFEEYLKKENYADKTIRSHKKNIRAFYRRYDISLPEDDQRNLMNPEIRSHIKNSEIFRNFKDELNLENTSTIDNYLTSLTGYCEYYDMTIEELIKEADDEEERKVRLSKRKLKNRLIKYRKHLYTKYANKTVSTKMSDIVYFYVINDVEIPPMPKPNEPYEPELTYKEIPTKEHVKRALETTTSVKNRALFLFCMTSGASSAEARIFSVREYMEGTEYYHGEKTDIQKALDKMDGKTDVYPVFHLVRKKKKKDYYSAITPEANQFIINYLKERENLTLDDKVFDYSRKGVTNAYQYVNDLNEWGWVKNNRQRFFTCHQMRRLNANIIDNVRLVHMIQGKKFDTTVEAYFKRDPNKIRDKYKKYIPSLTIYEKYEENFLTDEEWLQAKAEIKAKDEIIKEQEAEIKDLKSNVGNIENRLSKMSRNLRHIDKQEPLNIDVKESFEHMVFNLANKDRFYMMTDEEIENYEMTKVEEQLLSFNRAELLTIIEISYEIATTEEEYDGTFESTEKIIKKAIYRMKKNPDLIIKVKTYEEEKEMIIEKYKKLMEYLSKEIDEIGLWNDVEAEEMKSKILDYAFNNIKILNNDITEDLASELIEKFI